MNNDEINGSPLLDSNSVYDNSTPSDEFNDLGIINDTEASEFEDQDEQNNRNKSGGGGSTEKFDMQNISNVASASASAATGVMSVVATAVVAIVGAATLFNVDVINTADVNLHVNSIKVLDTSLTYDLEASCNEPLVLSVYNDFYNYSITLENGINTGTVEGLKENMNYTFAITYKGFISDVVAYRNDIKTLEPIRITDFYEEEFQWECRCGVDGYFYFLMSFDDDYNYWSDFSATLTDDYGNVSYCEFNEDLHTQQRIPVVNFDGQGNELKGEHAILNISCTSTENGEKETITLYTTDCKI